MDKTSKKRLIIKGLICDLFIFALQFGGPVQSSAGPFKSLLNSVDDAPRVQISNAELLKKSQLSYRADGGFSGVQSYGVILSCINGHISVMKSIQDPRLPSEKAQARQIGSMSADEYLALWDSLDRHSILTMQNAPEPKMDINDEFTVRFYASLGNDVHQFQVHGIGRPEAARYFAVLKLIDESVKMQALWEVHHDVARHMGIAPIAKID